MFSKFFSIIIVCFILMFFTACKNSDNDSSSVPLTEEQKFEQEAVAKSYKIADDLEKTISKDITVEDFIKEHVVSSSSMSQYNLKLMENEEKKIIIQFLKKIKFESKEGTFIYSDKKYMYKISIIHKLEYKISLFIFDNEINDYVRIRDITLLYDDNSFKISDI